MKLIDILVEETIKNGWSWPERANCITQDSDREIVSAGCHPDDAKFCSYRNGWNLKATRIEIFESKILADDYATAIITREQYEAALAAKNDGWIEWGGGECPVDSDAIVDVKLKGGVQITDGETSAAAYYWDHMNQRGDIIAYRLHQPQEAGQPEASEEGLNDCIGQAPAPLWNGEGLPPVGCECEYQYRVHGSEWCRFKCVAVDGKAVFGWSNNTPVALQSNTHNFRPIRSEADRKRDAAIESIDWYMPEFIPDTPNELYHAKKIYDAIAAGKIPGVKLED